MKERARKPAHRSVTRDGPFQPEFREYAKVLDKKRVIEQNEKRERLVKASRDVTQMSKKLIFALHRIKQGTREDTIQQASETATKIRAEIASRIAKEIDEENYYVFHRAFSPGFQEYVEARTFLEFLRDGTLLGLEALQEEIHHACEEKQVHKMNVDATDYLLGIADLTGELMRRAVATGPESKSICEFLRNVENAFVDISKRFSLRIKDLHGKVSVMRASVEKVERSCFNRVIREAEMDEVNV